MINKAYQLIICIITMHMAFAMKVDIVTMTGQRSTIECSDDATAGQLASTIERHPNSFVQLIHGTRRLIGNESLRELSPGVLKLHAVYTNWKRIYEIPLHNDQELARPAFPANQAMMQSYIGTYFVRAPEAFVARAEPLALANLINRLERCDNGHNGWEVLYTTTGNRPRIAFHRVTSRLEDPNEIIQSIIVPRRSTNYEAIERIRDQFDITDQDTPRMLRWSTKEILMYLTFLNDIT